MRVSASGQGGDEPGLVEALRGVFDCSEEIAGQIAAKATDRRYPARSIVLHQGDRVTETYLMLAGRAHALVVGREGQQALLGEFTAGDLFGAIAQPEPAGEADVIAVEAIRTALFLVMDFLTLLERHGCVALLVSRMLTNQLQATRRRMAEDITLTATGRVCAELLRLARAGDGRRISPIPVVTALALRVHTTRETASRKINDLCDRQILRRDDDALVILSIQRLEGDII